MLKTQDITGGLKLEGPENAVVVIEVVHADPNNASHVVLKGRKKLIVVDVGGIKTFIDPNCVEAVRQNPNMRNVTSGHEHASYLLTSGTYVDTEFSCEDAITLWRNAL